MPINKTTKNVILEISFIQYFNFFNSRHQIKLMITLWVVMLTYLEVLSFLLLSQIKYNLDRRERFLWKFLRLFLLVFILKTGFNLENVFKPSFNLKSLKYTYSWSFVVCRRFNYTESNITMFHNSCFWTRFRFVTIMMRLL